MAVDEMLKKTSTTYAPWHILESVDKKYARIKALKNHHQRTGKGSGLIMFPANSKYPLSILKWQRVSL